VLRDAGAFVATGLLLVVLALGTWRVSTKAERDLQGLRSTWLWEDVGNLRCLAGLFVTCESLPMKDGVLDPYHFVRTGDIVPEVFEVLRSKYFGVGPTDEEIRHGDYTSFPWERYHGDPSRPLTPRFPLLWGRPLAKGRRLVGFSDGSVEIVNVERLGQWGLDR